MYCYSSLPSVAHSRQGRAKTRKDVALNQATTGPHLWPRKQTIIASGKVTDSMKTNAGTAKGRAQWQPRKAAQKEDPNCLKWQVR